MKTAIITGAGRGIGKAVALSLASLGYAVALLSRSEDELEAVADVIRTKGGDAQVFVCDVAKEEQVSKVVSKLQNTWSSLDLLFNNAGVFQAGTTEISQEDFKNIYAVNVFGAWNVLHATVPWFKKRENGNIINLASVAGTEGFPGIGAYCSSKFALRGLSESLHNELEPLGIRVTTISPSWVATNMAEQAGSPISGSLMIQPEDIAKTVEYIINLSPNVSLREVVLHCRNSS